jgi:predicted metal-dependent phosphoesterase TrpH
MGEKIELLSYYIDHSDEQLSESLDQARTYCRNRNDRIVYKLSDATRLNLSRADIPSPRGALGCPHIAKAVIKADIVPSIQAAFDDYLAAGEACYVPIERVDYGTAIHAIQRAGGVASLAHPGRITPDTRTVEMLVIRLTEARLNALKIGYPHTGDESRYADITIYDAAEMAGANELLRTTLSDCHGTDSGKLRFGTISVSDTELTALRT